MLDGAACDPPEEAFPAVINLADPAREHRQLQGPIEEAALRVLRSGGYILGAEVEAFQAEFAAYCGAAASVGVSNGSDAIVVALQALGIGPGDEVITTAFSYLATASAIHRVGATPVFADIDLATFNLDPARVAGKVRLGATEHYASVVLPSRT